MSVSYVKILGGLYTCNCCFTTITAHKNFLVSFQMEGLTGGAALPPTAMPLLPEMYKKAVPEKSFTYL